NDGRLLLWSSDGTPLSALEGHTERVNRVLELADGRLLSWEAGALSGDYTLHLWSGSGTPLARLQGHSQSVSDALELADGRLLSLSQDGTLRVWASDGSPLSVFYADAPITCCTLLSDGRTIAAGDKAGHVLFLRLVD